MIFTLFLSLFLPLLVGFVFVSFFWPDIKSIRHNFLIRSCLGVGFGFGIISCFFFLWLLVFPTSNMFIMIEVLFSLCFFAIYFYITKSRSSSVSQEKEVEPAPITKSYRVISACFYIIFAVSIANFILFTLLSPHGGWDAWVTWNMRARFIFRGGNYWRDGFSCLLGWTHPDYPLLIPALIARSWKYVGYETVMIPILLSVIFVFATAGLLFSSVAILRNRSQAFLAGLVLFTVPLFAGYGASQYADVHISLFFLAAIVIFFIHDKFLQNRHGILLLAGMAAAFSAWTKNEGLLFIIAISVARSVVIIPVRGFKIYLKQMLYFTIGLLPVLIIVIYFKKQLAPFSDLLFQQSPQLFMTRLLDSTRYLKIIYELIKELLKFAVPVLIIYLLCAGIKIEKEEKTSAATSLIVLSLMLAGYLLIYVISPRNLDWHLKTSLERLLLQLWPTAVFTYFNLVRPPFSV